MDDRIKEYLHALYKSTISVTPIYNYQWNWNSVSQLEPLTENVLLPGYYWKEEERDITIQELIDLLNSYYYIIKLE